MIVDAEPTDIVHFCFFRNLIGFKSAYIIKMLAKFAIIIDSKATSRFHFNMHRCNVFNEKWTSHSKAALLSHLFLLWNVKKVNSLIFINCEAYF